LSRYFFVNTAEKTVVRFGDEDLPISVGAEDADIPIPDCPALIGHVGDAEGHLFFQPVVSTIPVFYNNCEIFASVWMKSGDSLQAGSSKYLFTVSGDQYTFSHSFIDDLPAVGMTVQQMTPPGSHPSIVDDVGLGWNNSVTKSKFSSTRWLLLIFVILAVLLFGCFFILFGRPVHLSTIPQADILDIDGFFPAFSYGERYLCLPGTYTIYAEKEGYIPFEKEVEVFRSGENSFSFSLEKLPGRLLLTTDPAEGVDVIVDDKLISRTPVDILEIAPGNRQLRFEKEQYLPFSQEMQITGMLQQQNLNISLLPAWAVYQFTTDPEGAAVLIDGETYGVTPLDLELLQGEHVVEIQKAGFVTASITMEVVAGQDVVKHVSLVPRPATVRVDSDPVGATVLVDNQFKGVSPITMQLSPETHLFALQAAGYAQKQESYTFEPEEKRELFFKLTPEFGTVFFQVEPPTATLLIDGRKQNSSNGRFQLPARQTIIEVQHPSYTSYKAELLPRKAFSQRVLIELKPLEQRISAPSEVTKNSVSREGHNLILVRPTKFTMGAPRREAGRRANENEREVELTRPFFMSAHLVTNEEFRKFKPAHSSGTVGINSLDGNKHPVVNISWEDAVLYLNWLSDNDGLPQFYQVENESITAALPRNTGYRLPTEAEWEYVARKEKRTTTDRFPWAGSYPPRQPSGNYGDAAGHNILNISIPNYNDSFAVTSPVGSFPPNPAGFYDIGGNAAEWCHDYYTAYSSSREPDPLGPSSGSLHVIKGSGWRDYSVSELRLSYRKYHKKAQDDVGFRVARYAQ